jgi:hypothetical protein
MCSEAVCKLLLIGRGKLKPVDCVRILDRRVSISPVQSTGAAA